MLAARLTRPDEGQDNWSRCAIRAAASDRWNLLSSPCPICKTPSEKGSSGDGMEVQCPRCGPFEITATARAMLGSRLDDNAKAFARISYAIRTQTSNSAWFRVDSTNIDELA